MRCADQKLMTLIMRAIQDFDAATGDAIRRLNATTVISALTRAFDTVAQQAGDAD